jgi:DHA1 family multidrug resistance protein-like MFS transporter
MRSHWVRDSLLGHTVRLFDKPSWSTYPEENSYGGEAIDENPVPFHDDTGIRVDWYSADDKENPHNWPQGRKAFVLGVIGAYSFVVYMAAAIYTPSEGDFAEEFEVGEAEASLGLSLYV